MVGIGMVSDGVESKIRSRLFDCMDTVSLGKMMYWV